MPPKRVHSVGDLQAPDSEVTPDFVDFITKKRKRQHKGHNKSQTMSSQQQHVNTFSQEVCMSQSINAADHSINQSSNLQQRSQTDHLISTAINTVLGIDTAFGDWSPPPPPPPLSPSIVDVARLQTEVQFLHSKVNTLSQQVAFLMQTLGVVGSQMPAAESSSGSSNTLPTDNIILAALTSSTMSNSSASTKPAVNVSLPAAASTSSTFASNSKKQPPTFASKLREDIVTAVHVDLENKERRKRNMVITGFPNTEVGNDTASVVNFLRLKFPECNSDFKVTSCRRLGHPDSKPIRPLLVSFAYPSQAQFFVQHAKRLRSSVSGSVYGSVYINADLTPSQARAAYELRIQKRAKLSNTTPRPPGQNLSTSLSD